MFICLNDIRLIIDMNTFIIYLYFPLDDLLQQLDGRLNDNYYKFTLPLYRNAVSIKTIRRREMQWKCLHFQSKCISHCDRTLRKREEESIECTLIAI